MYACQTRLAEKRQALQAQTLTSCSLQSLCLNLLASRDLAPKRKLTSSVLRYFARRRHLLWKSAPLNCNLADCEHDMHPSDKMEISVCSRKWQVRGRYQLCLLGCVLILIRSSSRQKDVKGISLVVPSQSQFHTALSSYPLSITGSLNPSDYIWLPEKQMGHPS